jgi:hypothetical protein
MKHLKIDKLEEDLEDYYQEKAQGLVSTDADLHIKILEEEHTKLYREEELWRQRSRAIWIKSGDQNTKFFHQFASNRRNGKTIWEIQDENDQFIQDRRHLLRKWLDTSKSSTWTQDKTQLLNK